jgi:hypothetical protein
VRMERDRRPRSSRLPATTVSLLVLLASLSAPGCFRLIAPYDEQTQQAIFTAARDVDQFYGDLLEAPPSGRAYAKFSGRYVQIDTELRALVLRNEVRPLNQDSTGIVRDIQKLWEEKQGQHHRTDGYSDGAARLDRARFTRLFRYAATAERAKPRGDEEDSPDTPARDGGS